MPKLLRRLAILLLCCTLRCYAQTQTTVTGTIKDLTGAVVTSGTVTFDLQPSITTVIGANASFTPFTIICAIQSNGTLENATSTGPCVVTMNTVLTPAGTSYKVTFNPYNATASAIIGFYASQTTQDITSYISTPTTSPVFNNGGGGGALAFTCSQPTASNTWTCTHNFGTPSVVVSCYNTSGVQIFPDSLIATSPDVVTVNWINPQAGQCDIMAGGTNGSSNPFIGTPWSWTGFQNFSGINSTSINNAFWAGPGARPTIATQETAAIAAGGGVVNISSGYTGAESANCSTNGLDGFNTWSGNSSVEIIDFRTGPSVCQYSIQYNSIPSYGLAPFAATEVFNSPSTTASAAIFTAKYTGNIAAGGGNLNGTTSELDVVGSITGSPATMSAHISESHVRSLGGTISDLAVYSALPSIDRAGTTTNITRSYGYFANACGNSSTAGATIANCYGFYTNHNTAGTNSNYAFFSNGKILLAYFAGDNGLDMQSSGGTNFNILQDDGTDAVVMKPMSDSKGWLFENTSGQPLLQIDRNGANINIGGGISDVAPVSGNTGFQHLHGISGCTTGTSIGNTCGTAITVTWTAPFLDTNYTVTCSPDGAPTNLPSTPYIASKSASAVTVNYFAITAAAASWATVGCIAVHN